MAQGEWSGVQEHHAGFGGPQRPEHRGARLGYELRVTEHERQVVIVDLAGTARR
jgi:hypothetical protein